MKEDKQPINQPDQDNALEGLINTPDGDVLSVPMDWKPITPESYDGKESDRKLIDIDVDGKPFFDAAKQIISVSRPKNTFQYFTKDGIVESDNPSSVTITIKKEDHGK